jgi:hypothetical protein
MLRNLPSIGITIAGCHKAEVEPTKADTLRAKELPFCY